MPLRNDFVDLSLLAAGMLGDAIPPPIALDGSAGAAALAARNDHTHTAKTQRATTTLDANGEATWTYARALDTKPVIGALYEESADSQPITVKVKAHLKTGAQWTGVTVKGYRAQALPSSIALLTVLVNFNVASGGAAPAGIIVNLTAAEATQ